MFLGEPKGWLVGGVCLLIVGMFMSSLAYLSLQSERSNWWNAQMELDWDEARGDLDGVGYDEYNIRLAESNIWEAEARLSLSLLAAILGVGLLGIGMLAKK